jgi:hypothetical protein
VEFIELKHLHKSVDAPHLALDIVTIRRHLRAFTETWDIGDNQVVAFHVFGEGRPVVLLGTESMKEYDCFSFPSFQVDYPVIVDLDFLLDKIGGASLGINREL